MNGKVFKEIYNYILLDDTHSFYEQILLGNKNTLHFVITFIDVFIPAIK
jgi:hypothetical protein